MKPYLRFTRMSSMLVSVIILTACSSKSATTGQTDETGIFFEPCGDVSGIECGMFEVPLIHDSTDNRKIVIEVARLPATGAAPHEPLLLNLDTPGSGIEVLQELAQSGIIPAAIREHFDVIGMNQRGLVNPLQVDCEHLGNGNPSSYPRDQQDITTLVADSTMLADSCSALYGDQLQWLGSNAVVQDMEVLRSMLNTSKLNMIGGSFGTRITALYLQRFPDSSGRVILDAPLPPDGRIDSLLPDTAAVQQRSFDQMLNVCGTALPDCDRDVVEAAFVARVNSLFQNGEQETFSAFFSLLSPAVNDSEIGELLAPLLIDYAISGDPTDMFTLIADFDLENDDAENGLTLETATLCADDAARPDVESLLLQLGALNESSDLFAEAVLPIAARCVGWPAAIQPVEDIRTADAPVSLVVGGIGDVNTPINWAVEMAEAIGGVFLSSDHQGHTTVFTQENVCVDSIVVDFLLEGTLPPPATSCN